MYKEIIDFKKVLENYDKKKTCFVFDVDETLINTSREDFGKSNLTKEQINKITKNGKLLIDYEDHPYEIIKLHEDFIYLKAFTIEKQPLKIYNGIKNAKKIFCTARKKTHINHLKRHLSIDTNIIDDGDFSTCICCGWVGQKLYFINKYIIDNKLDFDTVILIDDQDKNVSKFCINNDKRIGILFDQNKDTLRICK